MGQHGPLEMNVDPAEPFLPTIMQGSSTSALSCIPTSPLEPKTLTAPVPERAFFGSDLPYSKRIISPSRHIAHDSGKLRLAGSFTPPTPPAIHPAFHSAVACRRLAAPGQYRPCRRGRGLR